MMSIVLSDVARERAKKLFLVQGKTVNSDQELASGVERLLSECVQHSSDPVSTLGYVIAQSFGRGSH